MGSKLRPQGNFPRDSHRLLAVPWPATASGNIWYRAESGPLHGHTEGQDVTRCKPSIASCRLRTRGRAPQAIQTTCRSRVRKTNQGAGDLDLA
jgi:hypothetical protein